VRRQKRSEGAGRKGLSEEEEEVRGGGRRGQNEEPEGQSEEAEEI
jgi:hypothetical protein